ncbi:hypothetical protein OG948_05865 [Embleya sp. NBC_00888]|nr:hypothetical protein OG948_05865 [Embleya sp. NBC_00888]
MKSFNHYAYDGWPGSTSHNAEFVPDTQVKAQVDKLTAATRD